MTVRFVGPGGSDAADGLSWANRKETLNGVEDTPVATGDLVWIGPGTYREKLIVDVNGSSGQEITYVGDVTGENTDGVGGFIRITGTDDDVTVPQERQQTVNLSGKSYRIFKQLYFSEVDDYWITEDAGFFIIENGCSNIDIQYCIFDYSASKSNGADQYPVRLDDSAQSNIVVSNCIALPTSINLIHKYQGTDRNLGVSVIENCINWGACNQSSRIRDGYNISFKNCSFIGGAEGVTVTGISGGNQVYLYDNMFAYQNHPVREDTANTTTGDYNTFSACGVVGIQEGADSITGANIPYDRRILKQGYRFPHDPLKFLSWNSNVFVPDQGNYSTDFFGMDRHGKSTRGAVQFYGAERTTDEYRTAPSSAELIDASKHIITIPATSGARYRVKVFVKREANYAGTLPQLVLKAPSVSNVTDTDTGSVGSWNKLQANITLGSNDKVLQIEIRSNNTATSGDYKVFVDDLSLKITGAKRSVMRWITNELLLFSFELDEVVDPWILPTIPAPGAAPTESLFHPVPSFYRS